MTALRTRDCEREGVGAPRGGDAGEARSGDSTRTTAAREGLSRDAALEALTTRVGHRFRPELLALFSRFVKRLSTRPVQAR